MEKTDSCIFKRFCYSFGIMVIRMRHTRSHTANRRSHHALKAPELAVCSNCGAKHRPHHMCLACGHYKGRLVVDMVAKKKAREDRLVAKRERIEGEQPALSEAEEKATAPDTIDNTSSETKTKVKAKAGTASTDETAKK